MAKTLIMIHGRNWKPPEAILKQIWVNSIIAGVERDYPKLVNAFSKVKKEMVYYGDISNAFLHEKTGEPVTDDGEDRKATLEDLKHYEATDFTKSKYNKIPGKESLKEGAADVLSPLLSFFHLTDPMIAKVAPDMAEYWNEESKFGTDVRFPMIAPLKKAMDRGDSICVISHSLGTLISFDTFWKFSHTGEYRPDYSEKKIAQFISLGSPLGDETVMRKIKGQSSSGVRRYPNNIERWDNIAAEDDFVSHDEKIRDDYREMLKLGIIDSIQDHKIYNLAMTRLTHGPGEGRSNPHNESGYLIHPTTVATIVNWLRN